MRFKIKHNSEDSEKRVNIFRLESENNIDFSYYTVIKFDELFEWAEKNKITKDNIYVDFFEEDCFTNKIFITKREAIEKALGIK